MPRYPNAPIGHPLDLLAEECAELIKEICKARRFGLQGDSTYVEGEGNDPPINRIVEELGDIAAIIGILVSRHMITDEAIIAAKAYKYTRMITNFGDKRVLSYMMRPEPGEDSNGYEREPKQV